MSQDPLETIETYGDYGIASANAKVPRWLVLSYILLPIMGVLIGFLFWNGSRGWFDRGYWQELQRAAGTTFPSQNFNNPSHEQMKKSHLNDQEAKK